ncbi:Hypothetical predicted protein [Mytilus galloprovincialis]|uniref:Peptidase A2 domain-containing protein n=1 Tax=Mytilus galloprovincialis TaxID=29158 RepID=A0A8B6GBW9_MYTGA|nr:Hypothetical predicted protein [Mytilus galloprovincialis]
MLTPKKTFNDVKSVNTFNDVQSDKTFNDVHTDKTTFNDVDTDTTVCGKAVVCEERSVGNKVDNVFDINIRGKKGTKNNCGNTVNYGPSPKGIDVGNQVDISETSTVTDGSERIFTTMQLGNSSLLRLSLELGDTPLVAAVDTAAEVTIISDKVFESLKKKPPMLRETVMHAAGRGMKMKTLVVGPVKLRIGTKLYETDVYVAPIDDDMLLGLNFMVAYGVTVDLEKLTFNIGGEMLEMSPGPKRSIPVVSQVVIRKKDCSSAAFSCTRAGENTPTYFQKDEFDIGTFRGVEHSIDTGQAQPIKQRMRRTPLQFVEEEKQQLAKMLKSGVIEPSMSEWASAPVLIRKSDGKIAGKPCPEMSISVNPESLPCGGCKYCVKVHEQWQDFRTIDNVIPLAAVQHDVNRSGGKEYPGSTSGVIQGAEEGSRECNTTTMALDGVLANTASLAEESAFGIQYTTDQLSSEQAMDPDLLLILHWLQKEEEPPDNIVYMAGPAAKKYLVNKEQFCLDKAVLFNRSKGDQVRLVVPKAYIQESKSWPSNNWTSRYRPNNR